MYGFLESGLEWDWSGGCYKYPIYVQMLYPFLQMSWTSLFIEKQILNKPAELTMRRKEKRRALPPCGIQSLWKLLWMSKCRYLEYMH